VAGDRERRAEAVVSLDDRRFAVLVLAAETANLLGEAFDDRAATDQLRALFGWFAVYSPPAKGEAAEVDARIRARVEKIREAAAEIERTTKEG
jgi:hypothetical protein